MKKECGKSRQGHKARRSISKNSRTIIDCEECGYWHVHPMLTEEELTKFYETQYYDMAGENRSMTDKIADADGFYAMQYRDRLRNLMKVFPDRLPKTVLDIGAGYGDFLRFMKKSGWLTQGVEPSKHAIGLIKDRQELNIVHDSVYSLSKPLFKPSAVITINNVLEHLTDPRKVLETIKARLLLPDGILLAIVPNDFSPLQNMLMRTVLKEDLEKQYYWVDPPDHLNYWSADTFRRFLMGCGFEVVKQTTDFPMEFFPLFGENYVSQPEIGRSAHLKRVAFEKIFDITGNHGLKDDLYESFLELGIGRNILFYCKVAGEKK